jgi:hypothetical protein
MGLTGIVLISGEARLKKEIKQNEGTDIDKNFGN